MKIEKRLEVTVTGTKEELTAFIADKLKNPHDGWYLPYTYHNIPDNMAWIGEDRYEVILFQNQIAPNGRYVEEI